MRNKKLTRSANKAIAGVCGGIADYLDVDATVVRAIYAALTILSAAFPGVLLYLILLLIMPDAPKDNFGGKQIEDVEIENK